MTSMHILDLAAIMFRTLLRRYGVLPVITGLTFISILLSVGISCGLNALLGSGPLRLGLLIAVLAPAIITPAMAWHMLHLLSQLDRAEQRLQVLSNTDELTQVFNRRYFIQFGEQELRRARRYGQTFSIGIMDLDNFKTINDHYGHLAGDQVLSTLSRLCRSCIRDVDIFARYGGDEFIFLFPYTGSEDARRSAGRIFETISSTPVHLEGREVQLLLSMGLATFNPETTSLDDLLAQADRALYQAKKSGGSKFICA